MSVVNSTALRAGVGGELLRTDNPSAVALVADDRVVTFDELGRLVTQRQEELALRARS